MISGVLGGGKEGMKIKMMVKMRNSAVFHNQAR